MDITTKLTESKLKPTVALIIREAEGMLNLYLGRNTDGKLLIQNSIKQSYIDACTSEDKVLSVAEFIELKKSSLKAITSLLD